MSETGGDILLGALAVFGLNIMLMAGSVFLGRATATDFWMVGITFVGLTQLVYVVPLFLYWRKSGRHMMARGAMIAGSTTILLNATCFGFMYFAHP